MSIVSANKEAKSLYLSLRSKSSIIINTLTTKDVLHLKYQQIFSQSMIKNNDKNAKGVKSQEMINLSYQEKRV